MTHQTFPSGWGMAGSLDSDLDSELFIHHYHIKRAVWKNQSAVTSFQVQPTDLILSDVFRFMSDKIHSKDHWKGKIIILTNWLSFWQHLVHSVMTNSLCDKPFLSVIRRNTSNFDALTHWGRDKWPPFSDDIFKCIFLNENVFILIKISLKFVPKGQINNIPALV